MTQNTPTKTSKPFGTWPSPLSPRALAGQLRLNDVAWAGDGETLVWLEGRDGRGVLVAQRPGDAPRDLIDELSARGGVGYGGGEFTVFGDNVYFAATDGRLYHVHLDTGAPRPLTPAFGNLAAPTVSPDGKNIVYVHTDGKNDVLAAIDAAGKTWPTKLASGADFYMQPAWHPNNLQLAWIAWDHPQMPWSGTRLETAAVYTGPDGSISLGETLVLAGNTSEAVLQPTFSPDGKYLAYASDRSGWWQIYVLELGPGTTRQLTHDHAEHGGPAWVQGLRVFAWTHDSDAILVIKNDRAISTLVRHPVEPGPTDKPQIITALDIYQDINQPAVSATGNIAVLASASQIPPRVVTISADSYNKDARTIRHASSERLPQKSLAKMQPMSWQVQTPDGPTEVFGNYYAPTNQHFQSSGLPPAIITIHGGPTAQRRANYEPASQFFATRGFAVLDVNYRGSTGYGRKYADALLGNWGITDVEDAVSAAQHLAAQGLADPNKIVIMGGSAGGYTVLQTLATNPGVFKAGVCLYGISNLFALLQGTHKFEAHYNDSLLGVLPEATQIFRDRSPLWSADNITDALAIYHGAQDQVVPLDQAEAIVASLTARNVPHAYHVYPDEGHGWRRAQNIEHFYTSLLAFLSEKVIFS